LRQFPQRNQIFGIHRSQPPPITADHIRSKIQKALKNIELLDVQEGNPIYQRKIEIRKILNFFSLYFQAQMDSFFTFT
jgi:hypothetical protein